MVSRLKKMMVIMGLFVMIIVIIYIKSNPKLSVFSETYQDINKSKFDIEFTNLLTRKLNQFEMPGMQVAIKINDELYKYNIGTIDYKRTKKVREENVYKIGSVTKIFTATLVLKLTEEGYFCLEDTLDKWFPDITYSENIQFVLC